LWKKSAADYGEIVAALDGALAIVRGAMFLRIGLAQAIPRSRIPTCAMFVFFKPHYRNVVNIVLINLKNFSSFVVAMFALRS
jgi:hypothetical protein